MKRSSSIVAVIAVALAGCASVIGLSDFDIVDDADGGLDGSVDNNVVSPDANVDDGGADATVVLPPVTCIADASACDRLDLDGGFRPVGIAQGNATSCPDGFGALVLTKAAPITTTGTCGCVQTSSTLPTCPTSFNLQLLAGDDPISCHVNEAPTQVSATCSQINNMFGRAFHEVPSMPGTNAACAASADKSGVQATPTAITICPPAGTCEDAVCEGQKLGALRSCIIADGDLPCPSGPFSDRLPVGDALNVTCTGSTCTCSASNPLCNGQLQIFSDHDCTVPVVAFDAGVCTQNPEVQLGSERFISTPTATFQVTGDGGAPTTTFTNPRTLCCVP